MDVPCFFASFMLMTLPKLYIYAAKVLHRQEKAVLWRATSAGR